jgi:hypothetical protein
MISVKLQLHTCSSCIQAVQHSLRHLYAELCSMLAVCVHAPTCNSHVPTLLACHCLHCCCVVQSHSACACSEEASEQLCCAGTVHSCIVTHQSVGPQRDACALLQPRYLQRIGCQWRKLLAVLQRMLRVGIPVTDLVCVPHVYGELRC